MRDVAVLMSKSRYWVALSYPSAEAEDAGIVALDPTARFEALFQDGVTLYGKVDRHLNARGHKELARFIWPAACQRAR